MLPPLTTRKPPFLFISPSSYTSLLSLFQSPTPSPFATRITGKIFPVTPCATVEVSSYVRDSYGAHFSLHFSSKSLPPRFSTQFSNLLHVKRPRKRNKLYRDLLQMETLNVRKHWHSTRFCPCFTRTSRLMPMKGLKNSTLLRCRRHKHGAILRRSHDDDFVCFCDSRDPTRAVHRPLLPAAVFLKLHPTIAGNKRAANNQN